MTCRTSRAFTLVESMLALGLLAVLAYLASSAVRPSARGARSTEVDLDQLQGLQLAVTALERDVRECREVVFPVPGGPSSRTLIFRDFEGRLVSYYFLPETRELRRAVMDLAGTASEVDWTPRKDVEGAYFSTVRPGVVAWGFFGSGLALLGGAAKENR